MSDYTDLISRIKQSLPFPKLFQELHPDLYRQHGNSHCPFHDDSRASFQLGDKHGYCHAGCVFDNGSQSADIFSLWMHARQVDFKTAVKQLCERANVTYPFGSHKRKLGRVVAVYEYRDESGRILFANRRHDPKTFTQAVPDNNGGYISKRGCMNGVRRVLWGLQELLAADPKEPVLILEGEKDTLAARSIGFVATTPPQGADKKGSKWPSLVKKWGIHEPLKNRVVWIIPDNDQAGREHAQAVANTLHGFAASVKVLSLPGLPQKGDVSDFIELHGAEKAKELLLKLAEATPEYEPSEASSVEIETPGATHRTDMGNARRLAETFGKYIKHCKQFDYMVYDGKRWVPDNTSMVQKWAKEIPRQLLRVAADITDEKERREAVNYALSCESATKLQAMIKLLPSEPGISIGHDEFDRHPMLLNVSNGTIDLETGKLREHDPADYITKLAFVEYRPDAKADRWLQFQTECLNDDDELVLFWQRYCGYGLTGLTHEQVWAFLYGNGENGKGVEVDSLAYTLGDYCVNTPAETFLESSGGSIRNDLARLRGARLITASEPHNKRFDHATLKAFTGQDPITARFLHREFFEFRPEGKLVFSANNRPEVRDTSHGFWRRVLLIEFLRKFSGGSRDPRLRDKLKAEASGILNWLIEGCLAWQKEGLKPPQIISDAVNDYRNATDVLADFLESVCTIAPEVEVPSATMYEGYLNFCENQKIRKPMSRQRFNEDLRGRSGIQELRAQHGKPKRWKGIMLGRPTGAADAGSGGAEVIDISKGKSGRTCASCDIPSVACPRPLANREASTCHYYKRM